MLFLCVDATVRLNSRPLAYVSLLSMFTMTTSLPAVVHAQLVWYYVVMLLFGCLMTVAAYFSSRFPRQFVEPLKRCESVYRADDDVYRA